jgi:primosomal protein N' (replication factor Y)
MKTESLDYVIARIAIPVPLRKLFDYLIPVTLCSSHPLPGRRVLVSFGKQKKIGMIVEILEKSHYDFNKLKTVETLLDDTPLFSTPVLKLIQWASLYYQQPLGEVFEAAIPNSLRKIEKDSIKKPKKLSSKTLKTPEILTLIPPHFSPNIEQQQAIESITLSLQEFKPFLLHGVTGSGKTEVYIQTVEAVIKQGRQALILVPEIGLTPQLLTRFQQRFTETIIVLNSSLSDKNRLIAWQKAKTGEAAIVIGTRLAAFVPLLNPGIFIIDEEHDPSFKQQDSFRYHARDLLIMRASFEQCPIVLGTATPSLETLHNAQTGKYRHLSLSSRAGCATTPSVQILDVRHKKLEEGLSLSLIKTIQEHLDKKGQVLLFLNRRGFSPVWMCFACGWVANCTHCDAKLTLHFKEKCLRCHHCEFTAPLIESCPSCESKGLGPVGAGTERIEGVLKRHFPTQKIERLDRDTTRKKGTMEAALNRIHQGEAEILLGTQMIAKGHHLPTVTLVAILDIDQALFSTDFRSIERMGQLIIQVAGRTGRAERPGHVILQTCHPEHPSLTKILTEGYLSLAETLLAERRTVKLPPFSYQALIRAEANQPQMALKFLQTLKSDISLQRYPALTLSGPVPAPMERRLKKHRAQLLVQSTSRGNLQKLLSVLNDKINTRTIPYSLKWSFDVDPIDLY